MHNKEEISRIFMEIQDDICRQLETADGKSLFREDTWDRPGGGGGRTRVITDGKLLAKGGVNYSAVWGAMSPLMFRTLHIEDPGTEAMFYATGVSIVLHPVNPMVPIIHMNIRYFELSTGIWWFGGGIDLTPHYIDGDDARFFHNQLKTTCDNHHAAYYPEFKQWADDYFYNKHRQETRGIGGIFFDRLGNQDGFTQEQRFAFVQEVGHTFCKAYIPIATKNNSLPYTEDHQRWQALRRGRYVEFNLVYDRGTKFGLETDGRAESILMSLPPQAEWVYDHRTEEGSAEAKTLSLLKKGIEWV